MQQKLKLQKITERRIEIWTYFFGLTHLREFWVLIFQKFLEDFWLGKLESSSRMNRKLYKLTHLLLKTIWILPFASSFFHLFQQSHIWVLEWMSQWVLENFESWIEERSWKVKIAWQWFEDFLQVFRNIGILDNSRELLEILIKRGCSRQVSN